MDIAKKYKIVVVGAGFAGLRCAKVLCRYYPGQVTLIEEKDHHLYWPMLYKLQAGEAKMRITTSARVVQQRVENYHTLDYDYLVLATGSTVSYYGIPGLPENALVLRSVEDAARIEALPDEDAIIVGGGVTGVELTAELVTMFANKNITLAEACPQLLPGLADDRVRRIVTRRLQRLGVKIILGHRLQQVDRGSLIFDNGHRLSFKGLIWAGGVMLGQYPVNQYLQVAGEANVFAIGDCSSAQPGMIESALRQADTAAANIKNLIAGRSLQVYRPRHFGIVIPLGGRYAVAKVGPLVFSGQFAWFLKKLIHWYYKKIYV
ncbi:FAD-dependent oxidoreductase [Candidatus Falkowbacteria bacterium]|nr:FAD-dependent oxidoreductase [Candidatus Falkowbacteria bacterium]